MMTEAQGTELIAKVIELTDMLKYTNGLLLGLVFVVLAALVFVIIGALRRGVS